ncbi:MAG TPA: cytochrome c [Chthoniobacterales bacterium]|nr:cytochrome c [Chthoniobacterales bacterium]
MKIIVLMVMSFFGPFSAQGADPKTNWANNCMQCHGPDGSANTSMGKALNAKDLTNAAIQSSFSDAEAAAAIKDGVTKDGITKMLAFGGKLSDDEIKALVAYVRTLKK